MQLPRELQFPVREWTKISDKQLSGMRKLLSQHKNERAEVSLLRRFGEERAAGRELVSTQKEVRDRSNMWAIRKDEVDRRRAELDQTISDHEQLVVQSDRKIAGLKARALHEQQLIADTEAEIGRLIADQDAMRMKKDSEFAIFQRALEDRNFLEEVWRVVNDSDETPSVEVLDALLSRIGNLETQNVQQEEALTELHAEVEKVRTQAAQQPLKLTIARLENEATIDSLATKRSVLEQGVADYTKELENLATTEEALKRRIVAIETGLNQLFDRMIAVCPYASRQRALVEQRTAARAAGNFAPSVAAMAERILENKNFMEEAASLIAKSKKHSISKNTTPVDFCNSNVQIVRGSKFATTSSALNSSRSANLSKSMTF